MLMHHANAGGDTVPWPVKDGGRTVNQDVPCIRPVKARQHIHQCRFASTILTEKAENFACPDIKMNILVGLDSAKPFADTAQFNIHGSIFITDGSHKKNRCPGTSRGNGHLSESAADVDRTVDDAGADCLDFGFQRCRNGAVKAVIRCQANTLIGQRTDHHATIELAVHGLLDHLHHG